MTRFSRPNITKLCYKQPEKNFIWLQTMVKMAAVWSMLAAYTVPFFFIPRTVHPLLGWALYLLGSSALSSIIINTFLLPPLPVLMPWLGIIGALAVTAFPWYSNGIVRALALFGYSFCFAPLLWGSLQKVLACLNVEREAFLPRLGEYVQSPQSSKLYWGATQFIQVEEHEDLQQRILVSVTLIPALWLLHFLTTLATKEVENQYLTGGYLLFCWEKGIIRDFLVEKQDM